MRTESRKVYIVSYETAFGTCVEYFRTNDKEEAREAVDRLAEDGTRAFIDTTIETVYR